MKGVRCQRTALTLPLSPNCGAASASIIEIYKEIKQYKRILSYKEERSQNETRVVWNSSPNFL